MNHRFIYGMLCDFVVSDSFVLTLWKANIRTFTARQQEPWCCWLHCTPATRWSSSLLFCIMLFIYYGTRLHLPDGVRMFWLSQLASYVHVPLILCSLDADSDSRKPIWNCPFSVPTVWCICQIAHRFPQIHSTASLSKPVIQPVCGGNENERKMIQVERVKSKHEMRALCVDL